MTNKKAKGEVTLVVLSIIIMCFAVGGFFALKSKAIDSPVEQAVEAVLKAEGIDYDFSAAKKAELKDSKAEAKDSSKE